MAAVALNARFTRNGVLDVVAFDGRHRNNGERCRIDLSRYNRLKLSYDRTSAHNSITAIMRARGVPTAAANNDSEIILRTHERPGSRLKRSYRQARLVMQPARRYTYCLNSILPSDLLDDLF